MPPVSPARSRLRYILFFIILMTLPCYCIGLIAVAAAPTGRSARPWPEAAAPTPALLPTPSQMSPAPGDSSNLPPGMPTRYSSRPGAQTAQIFKEFYHWGVFDGFSPPEIPRVQYTHGSTLGL
jgi:hypothetical protein